MHMHNLRPFFALHRRLGLMVHTKARRTSKIPVSGSRGFFWNRKVMASNMYSTHLWDTLEFVRW